MRGAILLLWLLMAPLMLGGPQTAWAQVDDVDLQLRLQQAAAATSKADQEVGRLKIENIFLKNELSTADKNDLPDSVFAFPKERKEPLENAAHVRNAVARFNQVEGVSEAEKDAAWKRIKAAAKKFNVELNESGRDELKPSSAKKSHATN